MPLDVNRALINVNGVSVPGINRDGAFISEAPINTFIVQRSGAFTAGEAKTFIVDFPILLRTLVFQDTTNNATYTITVTTIEGIVWILTVDNDKVIAFGNCKVFYLPQITLDKGTRVTISSNNALQSVSMFSNLAYNIDVVNF